MDRFLMYYQDSRHGKILLPTSHPVDCPCNSCMIGNMYMKEEFIRAKIEEKKHRKPSLCQAMAREFEKYGYLHDEDYESDGEDDVYEEKSDENDEEDEKKERDRDELNDTEKQKGDEIFVKDGSSHSQGKDEGQKSLICCEQVSLTNGTMNSQTKPSVMSHAQHVPFIPVNQMVDDGSKILPAYRKLPKVALLPDLQIDSRKLVKEIFQDSTSCMQVVDYLRRVSTVGDGSATHPYAGLGMVPRNFIPYQQYSRFLKRRIVRVVSLPVKREILTKEQVMEGLTNYTPKATINICKISALAPQQIAMKVEQGLEKFDNLLSEAAKLNQSLEENRKLEMIKIASAGAPFDKVSLDQIEETMNVPQLTKMETDSKDDGKINLKPAEEITKVQTKFKLESVHVEKKQCHDKTKGRLKESEGQNNAVKSLAESGETEKSLEESEDKKKDVNSLAESDESEKGLEKSEDKKKDVNSLAESDETETRLQECEDEKKDVNSPTEGDDTETRLEEKEDKRKDVNSLAKSDETKTKLEESEDKKKDVNSLAECDEDDSVFGILGIYCRSEIHSSYLSDDDVDKQTRGT